MKFDLYVRDERCPATEPFECVMWAVLPDACVWFTLDGRYGIEGTALMRMNLLNNGLWVKLLADVDVA